MHYQQLVVMGSKLRKAPPRGRSGQDEHEYFPEMNNEQDSRGKWDFHPPTASRREDIGQHDGRLALNLWCSNRTLLPRLGPTARAVAPVPAADGA